MSRLGNKLRSLPEVIIRPYLTERTTTLATTPHPVYAFVVAPTATRATVARAFQAIYGHRPSRVNIINVSEKRIVVRGRVGKRPGFKKALVALNPGEKIDFV